MKSYLKYIVLFIILVAIGIVGINLYSNQTLKNINSKTENKQTSNQEKENNKTLDKSTTNSNENKNITTDTSTEKATNAKKETNKSESNTNTTTSNQTTSSSNNTPSINDKETSDNQTTVDASSKKESTNSISQEEKNEIEVEENQESNSIQSYTNNSFTSNNEITTSNTDDTNSASNNFVIEVDPSIYEEITDTTKTVIYPTYPTEATTNSDTNNNTENNREIPKTIIEPTYPQTSSQITKITLNKTMITLGLESSVTSIGKNYTTNKMKLNINETITNDKIVWSVVNGSTVAKVDSNGNVTALHGGTAIVRASLASNPNIYANCQVTVVHELYENVKITSKVTVKDIYTGKSITLASGKKVVLLGELKHKRNDYKNKTYPIRIDENSIAKISGKYLKFLSYYVDDGYTNQVYENFINDIGFTSKTNYLIWVNRGTQRLMLFKKENSKWTLVENVKTSTGDSEGKYTGDSGGSTVTRFNLEVQDFNSESSVGRAIHVRYETTKKNHGNTMHVGSLPKNTAGGNSSENAPSSHGCPHLSTSFRNKLYNTYNGGSKNKLINSKVIYY